MKVTRRVFVIGLDGASGWAVREAYTPNIDELLKEGVVAYNAKTVYPSSSYEAWGSLFHGVSPEKHKISSNNPCPDDTPWPSFIKVIRENFPQTKCAIFSCWEPIITHIYS